MDPCDLFKGRTQDRMAPAERIRFCLSFLRRRTRRLQAGFAIPAARWASFGPGDSPEGVFLGCVVWTCAELPEVHASLSASLQLLPTLGPVFHLRQTCHTPLQVPSSVALSLCSSDTPLPAPRPVLTGPDPSSAKFRMDLSWPIGRHTPQWPPHFEMWPLHLRNGFLTLLHQNLN